MDGQTVVIRLELHLADQSMTGRASAPTGAAREFAGWMGMVAAVDALLAPRGPAAPNGLGAPEEMDA